MPLAYLLSVYLLSVYLSDSWRLVGDNINDVIFTIDAVMLSADLFLVSILVKNNAFVIVKKMGAFKNDKVFAFHHFRRVI